MSTYPYSDLEVAPGKAPEVVPGNAPEALPCDAPEIVPDHKEDNYSQRHICGLKFRTFWIVFGVSVTLIIGGIAGGVAGGLQSKNNGSGHESTNIGPSSTLSASSTPSTSTTLLSTLSSALSTTRTASTRRVSTTTVILPTATLLRDCPSSNGTLYDVTYGSGEPLTFRKFCTAGFRHILRGVDVINEPRQSLNGCINSCIDYNDKNRTAIASGDNQTCNAVCWRSNEQLDNINQIPGQCFGFTTMNDTGGFQITDEVLCDSAGWINQRDL